MAAELESQLNRAKGSALTFSFTHYLAHKKVWSLYTFRRHGFALPRPRTHRSLLTLTMTWSNMMFLHVSFHPPTSLWACNQRFRAS